ncbi:molybdopterin molybdotransferase MoeA [Advenella mimigardefordensis]|uniref:Molybdopterin molybdenumtransferase n=1 Tax=Advenella mimigardefordensis (strain DSM 17166 / LMG 22922 / DPN7) TaxID=1247726 RepID=W0PDG5_ADVMD|nr:gephyrin-like molybdotransferase Glp [Advenella mimigardefordensis]AHG64914.1 molybdopterin molybdenumtransferase [Advenella mimigardefordensis DPN7]
MLDFDTAQQRLLDLPIAAIAVETVSLQQALGRVLAQDVVATLDMPSADNSSMDGYALRLQDYVPGATLPVQQRVFAGQAPQPQEPGTVSRIFTGSLIPDGADTVVIQEVCKEEDGQVTISEAPTLGQNIRRQGEDTRAGSVILEQGTLLGAAEINLIATQGIATLSVYRQLKVGILTTGDELVPVGQPRESSQIFNSNAPMLTALFQTMGAQVKHALHAMDDLDATREALNTLFADCDLVISVGGVSVGEKDLVKPALEALGASLDFWRVKMKPGKPVALSSVNNVPVICLPGNPVSAYTVLAVLVSPLIRKLQGRSQCLPLRIQATLKTDKVFNETRDEFLRVRITQDTETGLLMAEPYERQGSGISSSLPWANAFARVPAVQKYTGGDRVWVYLKEDWIR